jgi:glucose-1-phosphate cytidylyltransferase
MVPIGDRPILWHIMKTYAAHGHKDFILCLSYKGDMIKEYFRNYLWNTCDSTLMLGRQQAVQFHNRHEEEDWSVTLADTGEDSMTAHRIKQIQRFISTGENLLLTYGDGLATIDINASIAAHQAFGKACTISAVHPAGRFGALKIEDVNAGYMVCDYKIFNYLTDDPAIMLEREPIAKLVADGQLHSYRHEGFWQPMDTYQEYLLLNRLWAEGKAPWRIW